MMRAFRWVEVRSLSFSVLLMALAWEPRTLSADETDNFYLPLDVELADLGDFFDALHTRAIEQGVNEMNARIEQALTLKDPAAQARRLKHAHSPDTLAGAVAQHFGAAFTETWRANRAFRSRWARQAFPGKMPSYANMTMNLVGHFPLDPRALFMLSQADTIKAYGVYFGTDKLTHFHQVGWSYYKKYRSYVRHGLRPEEAYRKTLHFFASSGLLAEGNIFGTLGTGVYSNADMCVNHVGYKFFLNLTEKVTLKGTEQPPLVVRTGVFWQVNHHVRPQSGWFGAYVSDHWNEALNPNLFDPTMRARIRRVLEKRSDHIIQFYTRNDRRPDDPAYFAQLAHELSTYYGEAYGHSGAFEKLMHLGNVCFPARAHRGRRTQGESPPDRIRDPWPTEWPPPRLPSSRCRCIARPVRP